MTRIADTAAALFYGRLFALEPELRRLFRSSDMEQQRRKLMQTLGVAVAALDRLETLRPALEALGRRHVEYGVEAWTAAYTGLAAIMQGAAEGEREAA